jgi:hypothetical protein
LTLKPADDCASTVQLKIREESALYERYARFRKIVYIIRHKYGVRLADVVPTPASELYLMATSSPRPTTFRPLEER